MADNDYKLTLFDVNACFGQAWNFIDKSMDFITDLLDTVPMNLRSNVLKRAILVFFHDLVAGHVDQNIKWINTFDCVAVYLGHRIYNKVSKAVLLEDIKNSILMLNYVVSGEKSCIVVKEKRAFKTAMCLQVLAQLCKETDLGPVSIITCTQDLF